MVVTLSGIVMEVRDVQLVKALLPICTTLSPRVIEVTCGQEEKARSPIIVTLSGTMTSPFFPSGHCIRTVTSLLYKMPSTLA
jgi:hypothetical protein